MLPSCALCNRSDPHRMIALMALWFGRHAGLPADGGYFYLCPACYAETIEPHLEDVVNRLVEQHPFLHRLRADHEAHQQGMPVRQAGALPLAHDPPASHTEPSARQPLPHGAPAPPLPPPDAAA